MFLTALAAHVALRGNDQKWQCEAYEHAFGVYYRFAEENEVRWAWADDYFMKIAPARDSAIAPSYTPHPTPAQYFQTL